MRLHVAGNSKFDRRQVEHVITTKQEMWRHFDRLPTEIKRFLWFASQSLAIDPRKPNDLASLEERERERIRLTVLKHYGPDHPQAQ
jgi:hypothetical protein